MKIRLIIIAVSIFAGLAIAQQKIGSPFFVAGVVKSSGVADGPNTWYESGGAGSTWTTVGSSFMEYSLVTVAQAGTATKLKIRMRGGFTDATVKIAIYDSTDPWIKKGDCSVLIVGESADTTYEVNLNSNFSISATTYYLAISTSAAADVRAQADSGGDYATQAHAGFPPANLPASEGDFGTLVGGVYVD